MDPQVIPLDLHRMFLGEQPLLFYVEIALRTIIIYGYTLMMIRWIGGRGVAQLSMVEFVLVIALGSAVGDAMFYPEVPLLAAMMVITLVVATNKLLDRLIVRSDRAKRVIDGATVELVRDGRILPDGAQHRDLGMAEIKAMLRIAGVENLGQVRHAFLESGGGLSLFRREPPRPGLPLLPPDTLINGQRQSPPLAKDGRTCCAECGAILPEAPRLCPHCGGREWRAPETVSSEIQGHPSGQAGS